VYAWLEFRTGFWNKSKNEKEKTIENLLQKMKRPPTKQFSLRSN
jgi:hypothetical protein